MVARPTCACGECQKCKHRDYMNRWYRLPGRASRARSWAKRYRQENIEKVTDYDRKRWHPRTPEKERARRAANSAIERGQLSPQPCENCGSEGGRGRDGRRLIQAHHDDYSKPLEVRWLCVDCHAVAHRQVA